MNRESVHRNSSITGASCPGNRVQSVLSARIAILAGRDTLPLAHQLYVKQCQSRLRKGIPIPDREINLISTLWHRYGEKAPCPSR